MATEQSTPLLAPAGFGLGGPHRISPRVLVVYAVLVAGTRFIPLPVVDDLIPGQLVRHMVLTTLRTAQRGFPLRHVHALYAQGGCVAFVLEQLLWLPVNLFLYPVRKVWRVLKAVRKLSSSITSTYLLGHTIARALERGWMPDGAHPEVLRVHALLLRKAFDTTLEQTSPVVFSSSVAGVVGGVRGIGRATWRLARSVLRRNADAGEAPHDSVPSGAVDGVVAGVAEVIETPSVAGFLAEFDQGLDAELRRLIATTPGIVEPP